MRVIHVSNLKKTFASKVAANNISFDVNKSTCVGLLGPNGAGKTTALSMLTGQCNRDLSEQTTVDIFGFDPINHSAAIKYITGIVPQVDNLDKELTVEQNLHIFSTFHGLSKKQRLLRISELLDFFDLTDRRQSPIKSLSGGMRRRLIIARAMINSPKLLILDEPTTGLDPQVRHLIWDRLHQLKRQQVTILLTTHYMEEAYEICDKIIIMHEGKIIQTGAPRELLQKQVERYVISVSQSKLLQDILPDIDQTQLRIDMTHEHSLIYCNNIEILHYITDRLPVGYAYIREANLEDLFLKITGRMINDD